jgi:hypothetical protein
MSIEPPLRSHAMPHKECARTQERGGALYMGAIEAAIEFNLLSDYDGYIVFLSPQLIELSNSL